MDDELLQAILQRSDRLDGLLASEKIDPRDRRCAALRQFMIRGDWRRGDLDQTRKLVREVMDDPPENTALYQVTLASLAMVAMQRGHYAEACEVLDFADALAQPGDPAEVHAYRLTERARLLDLQGQSRQGLAKLSQALGLPIRAQQPMWYFVKSCRVVMAGALLEFSLAQNDLDELRACPESASPRPHPLSYIQMLLDYARGRLSSALENVRLAGRDPGTIDPKRITSYECEILIRMDRFQQASDILESPRGRELGPTARENLRALEALAKAELPEARSALGRSLQAEEQGATAYEKSAARRLLMELELASGQLRPAQRILASLDPSRDSPATLGLRGRLAALGGDLTEAADLLARLEELGGPELLQAELRLAWELSAATLSRLRLRMSRQRASSPAQDPTVQPQRASDSPKPPPATPSPPEQELVGTSRAITRAREQIERLACSDAGMLLVG